MDPATVVLKDKMGSDLSVVDGARVSFNAHSDEDIILWDKLEDADPELFDYLQRLKANDEIGPGMYATMVPAYLRVLTDRDRGLINFLMREKHATPFEHAVLEFAIGSWIKVSREVFRHRTGSYNEVSTRYKDMRDMRMYIPNPDHIRGRVGKPGAYTMVAITDPEKITNTIDTFEQVNAMCMAAYEGMVDDGIAPELASFLLPMSLETNFVMTMNLRNWFNFLSLRTTPNVLQEFRDVTSLIEPVIAEHFPVSYAAWVANGRGSI